MASNGSVQQKITATDFVKSIVDKGLQMLGDEDFSTFRDVNLDDRLKEIQVRNEEWKIITFGFTGTTL